MKLRKIGVIGAGTMGSGIAQKIAHEGFTVVLQDLEEKYVKAGLERIQSTLDEGVKRRLFTPEKVAEILGRIHATTDLADMADADLVVEAVFEDINVKKSLFKQLDEICKPETILATNTSSFLVKDIAEATGRPDKVVGLHYFFHPAKNRLLEVIPSQSTDPRTVDTSNLFGEMHGKVTILCKDTPGFIVNRFFIPWYLSAFRLLEDGVADIYTIEQVVKQTLRIGMGPFELINVTGPSVAHHAADGLASNLGDFYAPPANIVNLSESGGQWDIPKEGEIDESARQAIVDRVLGTVFQVVATLVQEGGATIEDVDRGAKVALRWSKGPFELMNLTGIDESKRMVQAICDRYSLPFPKILADQQGPFQFKVVDLEIKGPIAHITLNRPEASNAINPDLVAQLTASFDQAQSDPSVKTIVIRGAGKTFVAGADIRFFVKNMKAGTIDKIVDFTREGAELFRRFETSTKRTIVVLDGPSLGGGSEMALAADAIVATSKGGFQFPETGLGIYPGLGGTQRLAKMIGPELARFYLFTGFPISAKEAKELGIITELVDHQDIEAMIKTLSEADSIPDKYAAREVPGNFQPVAEAFSKENVAAMLARSFDPGIDAKLAKAYKVMGFKGPLAMEKVDQLVEAAVSEDLDAGLARELKSIPDIFVTEDAFEGLSKVGRARPEFKGK